MAPLIARQGRTDCCEVSHLRTPLRAVLGAALAAVADAGGVGTAPDHLVTEARQVAGAAAADQDDGGLLEVVTLAGNGGADFRPGRQPHTGDHSPRRGRAVRLRRRRGTGNSWVEEMSLESVV